MAECGRDVAVARRQHERRRRGGAGSWDRTEPPVGSRVLLELHRKYGDDWLVEACFDDLLGEWRSVSGAR